MIRSFDRKVSHHVHNAMQAVGYRIQKKTASCKRCVEVNMGRPSVAAKYIT